MECQEVFTAIEWFLYQMICNHGKQSEYLDYEIVLGLHIT